MAVGPWSLVEALSPVPRPHLPLQGSSRPLPLGGGGPPLPLPPRPGGDRRSVTDRREQDMGEEGLQVEVLEEGERMRESEAERKR